jgi:rubrerythrin
MGGDDEEASMQPSTQQHLLAAMHRAAYTFARSRLCAVQARHNGREQLAELFDEAADEAYFHHFAKEAELGKLVATEAENLHQLIEEETRDIDTVYRVFAAQADAAGDHDVAGCFREVAEHERRRRQGLLAAMRALDPADAAE